MSTNTAKRPMTRTEAEELIGTERSGGKVIGVTNRPFAKHVEDGIYLVISHQDKKSTYERVG